MKKHHKLIAISLVIFSGIFLCKNSFAEVPKIQSPINYEEGIDVSKYLISEKFDGVRARWSGFKLISRNGKLINAPRWFTEDFPRNELDGELWVERNNFSRASSIVRDKTPNEEEWREVKFLVFDLPKNSQDFTGRSDILAKIVKKSNSNYLKLVKQFEVANHAKLMLKLDEIMAVGGEGLILHKKDSFYKASKSDELLKLKLSFKGRATVISHIEGQGRLKGKLGALLVENEEKVRFKIGSGLSDKQRESPPKVGVKIFYKFYGKTKNNIPRFPVFLRW